MTLGNTNILDAFVGETVSRVESLGKNKIECLMS